MAAELRDVERATPSAARSRGEAPHLVREHLAWIRTLMAADRTLMAWNRTSLALIAFGFAIYRFFADVEGALSPGGATRAEAPCEMALALVLVATLGTFIALWQYRTTLRYLGSEQFKAVGARPGFPSRSVNLAVSVAVCSALIGIITAIWIIGRV